MNRGFFANLTWLTTALGSIHLGLIGLGFNVLSLEFFQTTAQGLVLPIHWVIGIAGAFSLLMYISRSCACGISGSCSKN